MPIPSDSVIIGLIEGRLNAGGFDLSEAPETREFIEVIIEEVMKAVKLATVSTVITGTFVPPSTAVTGTGTGGLT